MIDDEYQICTRCVLNSSFPGISFDQKGVCSVCRDYEKKYAPIKCDPKKELIEKRKILEQLCQDAKRKNRQFDVLVPLSGGKDSMYVLYLAVKELGLRALAFTLDNGYLTQHARDNIDRACRILGVEHIYYCMNPQLMQQMFSFFMKKTGYFCSICMRAIGMATERVAEMYDIPLVFGGSAAKVELPTAPEMFQSGEIHFVRNVFKNEQLPTDCHRLLYQGSLKRRLGYRQFWWGTQRRLRVCAWINLPSYMEWNYEKMFRTIRDELGWQSPSGNAEEHIDCTVHKASVYIHDRRWKGSETKRLTLAGLIMAGQMKRDEALKQLEEFQPVCNKEDLDVFLNDMHMTKEEFDTYIDMGPRYVAFRKRENKWWRHIRGTKCWLFSALKIKK
jgi:N-acetyl sugar amidotransferase